MPWTPIQLGEADKGNSATDTNPNTISNFFVTV